MDIAVWDTYVKQPDGSVLHFDILVPANVVDFSTIQQYGKSYLAGLNIENVHISTEMCQYCHIESATDDVKEKIELQGFDILEMETIPKKLPENPSRRMMILHIRAHHPALRFADFRSFDINEITAMINKLSNA